MSDAKIAFDILARDKASQTVNKVGDAVEKTGKKAEGAGIHLGGLGKLLAGGALIGGLGTLGKMGLQTAASMEQAKIAFTTMLGSGQKADAFLQQLQAFAAKTPFEFPELQSAASSLVSVGVNASDVIPIMTTLGNVTSGMGTGAEGVQRATVALQQMIAAQKISGEDLNQLRDAGIPVFDLLSKATGKSTAEVVKLAQSGKLGKDALSQMLDALKSGKGMERFAGLMDKQSQSLSGLWSTFQDTLGQGLSNLLTPVIPKLKAGLGTVSSVLGAFFTGLQDNGENTVDAPFRKIVKAGWEVRDAVEALADAFRTKVIPAMRAAWGVLGPTLSFLNQHRDALKAIAVPLAAMIGAWKVYSIVSRTVAAVQATVNAVMAANPIGLVVIALAGLTAGLIYAYKHSEKFRNIVHSGMHAVAVAVDFVKDHWKAFAIGFAFLIGGPMLAGIVLLVTHIKKVKGWLGDMVGFVKGLPGKIKSAAAGMWDGIKDAFRGALNWIIDKWNGLQFRLPTVDTHIPGIGKVGGFTLGTPDIPRLANGGIVKATPGGVLATIGEGGRDEAVIPLPRGGGPIGGVTVVVNGFVGGDAQIAQKIEQVLRNLQRTRGGLAFL